MDRCRSSESVVLLLKIFVLLLLPSSTETFRGFTQGVPKLIHWSPGIMIETILFFPTSCLVRRVFLSYRRNILCYRNIHILLKWIIFPFSWKGGKIFYKLLKRSIPACNLNSIQSDFRFLRFISKFFPPSLSRLVDKNSLAIIFPTVILQVFLSS